MRKVRRKNELGLGTEIAPTALMNPSTHTVLGDVATHLLRIAAVALALAFVGGPVRLALCVAMFLALFTFAHDLSHRALGLHRRTNAALLAVAGALMLLSGRAMRRMHLLHHARPLAPCDIEGLGATRSLWGSFACGPATFVRLRREAWRRAAPYERRAQLGEHVATMLFAAAAFSGSLGTALSHYAFVALAMQLTASFWASYMAHHTPPWLARLAAAFAFARSPVLLSLAFHEEHHRHPGVPCHRLSAGLPARRAPGR